LSEIRLYRDANQCLESEQVAQTAAATATAAAEATAAVERTWLAAELERVAEDRKNLQAACDELRGELQQLQASSSWRITQPFRALVSRLQRIKNKRHLPAPEPLGHDTDVLIVPQNAVAEDYHAPDPVSFSPEPRAPRSPSQNIFPNLRVVIVTPDIHGPIRNGGIGTAFAALAQQLATWGADITVAYALGTYSESEPASHWQKHYADLGIKFLALTETQLEQGPALDTPPVRQLPWRIYRWLERNEKSFDLAIFPEWMGLAYYALMAKGQGLAFGNLGIAVNVHSPEAWAMEGNRTLPNYLDLVDRDFMERECVRRADWMISPSRYMIDWMRGRKWEVPDRHRIIQNLMPDITEPSAGDASVQTPTTLVFFGRLELRKGLKLFCDAIDRLPPARRNKLRAVKFLGKAVTQSGFDSLHYIAGRTRSWGIRVDVVTNKNKDQALVELSRPGVLAVIASLSENSPYTVLECLHHGVRFVASRVGGITELVHPDDTKSCLFTPNPQALANCLDNAVTHGSPAARMAQPQNGTREQWQNWFQEVAQTRSAPVSQADAAAEKPLVSICLVHHNRPHYLAQALASLRAQSYPNIEVVLVDDGSPSPEAQQFLTGLEQEFRSRNWQLIRQPNSYLGAARNRAAEAARGQYLMFMDDDNIAMPHEVETFVSAARRSGADILTCAFAVFNDKPPATPTYVYLPLGGAAGAGMYRNVFGDANAFWKRDVFLQLGGHTTDYGVGHEDWELFAEAVLAGARLEVVSTPLFWYRVNTNGMLRSGDIWTDHARSARAYLRRDPSGLGMASAYAVFLQKSKEHEAHRPAIMGGERGHRIWRALLKAGEPSLRTQFIGVWRHQGFRSAVNRALEKASR
jgi:GT2 family glycosyltransferase/glycosyltransferase involved in cell wall biosynthesis